MSDTMHDSDSDCDDDYAGGEGIGGAGAVLRLPVLRLPVVTSCSGKRSRENADAALGVFMADADSTIDAFIGSPVTEATVTSMKKAFKASSVRYSRKLKNAGVVSESLQLEYKTVCMHKDELQHSLKTEKELTTTLKLDLMTSGNEVRMLKERLGCVRSLVDLK
jgi:hypothetical protein